MFFIGGSFRWNFDEVLTNLPELKEGDEGREKQPKATNYTISV